VTRYQLEDKFRQVESGQGSGFLRVTATHQVDLFVGVEDGRRALLLLCDEEPAKTPAFEAIAVTSRQREDGRWALIVCLERRDLGSLFSYLAEDLVYATEHEGDTGRAAKRLVERLKWWQRLLSRGQSGILGDTELRGLVGELLFLGDHAIPSFGAKLAMDSWVGPLDAPRDFRFADLDVEVKTLGRDSATVKISSLTQLEESGAPIVLAALVVESAVDDTGGAVSVHQLIERIRGLCEPDADIVTALNQRLWAAGYADRPEYKSVYFLPRGVEFYACGNDFPRIVTSHVPAGITRCVYEIELASIRQFRINEWRQGGHE